MEMDKLLQISLTTAKGYHKYSCGVLDVDDMSQVAIIALLFSKAEIVSESLAIVVAKRAIITLLRKHRKVDKAYGGSKLVKKVEYAGLPEGLVASEYGSRTSAKAIAISDTERLLNQLQPKHSRALIERHCLDMTFAESGGTGCRTSAQQLYARAMASVKGKVNPIIQPKGK